MEKLWKTTGFADNAGCELLISAKGKVRRVEKEDAIPISVSEIPEKVKQAALNKVKGLKITEAEMEIENGKKVYEIEGTANDKEYEIEIDADGKILDIDKDDDDDDDWEVYSIIPIICTVTWRNCFRVIKSR